jgi:cell division protease FtsH
MCASLGGRASEELNFGKISTGALNDLEKVTKQAYAMVTYFGMSPAIGNISFFDSSGQSEYSFSKPYSEKTAELIDKEVKLLIDKAYNRTKKILAENKEKLAELANLLLNREVIFSEDLEKIFGKRKEKDPEDKILITAKVTKKPVRTKDEKKKAEDAKVIVKKEKTDLKEKPEENIKT